MSWVTFPSCSIVVEVGDKRKLVFGLLGDARCLEVREMPDRLMLRVPNRPRVLGKILLFIALLLGIAAIVTDLQSQGGVVVLLCGSFGLWLTTSYESVILDTSQQKAFFTTHYLLFERERRNIPFEKIMAVYLDYNELVVADGDSAQIRRKWEVFFALSDGQTITVASEIAEHPIGETSALARQLAHWQHLWEDLGAKICTVTGKLLVCTPSVPGPPHTFTEQVDQILQRLLAQSQISGQGVHLRSQIDGSLYIEVDGKIYHDLKEIDDIAVRTLIQAAVDEWQDISRALR